MSQRSKSRKRNGNTPDINNDSNKNKKQKIDHNDSESVPTSLQLIELFEYHCCVCKELSAGQILQCSNGCILCEGCYQKLNPCKCPLCRVTMSRSKPIRCRIAERTLALRLIKCKYDGCGQEVPFGEMQQHETQECLYKPVPCKYADLGCRWTGLRSELVDHRAQCAPDPDAALNLVQVMQEQLLSYKQFVRKCTNIHQYTLFIQSPEPEAQDSGPEFEKTTEEFFYDGYEYRFRIQSKKKAVDNDSGTANDVEYEISIKLEFAEDSEQLSSSEELDIDMGVILETAGNRASGATTRNMLLKRVKEVLNSGHTESEWVSIAVMNEARYLQRFSSSFDFKIFGFGETE